MEYTDEQLNNIREQTLREAAQEPRIKNATYRNGQFSFELYGPLPEGVTITVSADKLPDFAEASDEQRAAMELVSGGNAIHWPALDVQFSTIAMLEILTGLRSLRSAQARGGRAKSPAKTASAAANGKLGGRPRKQPVAA